MRAGPCDRWRRALAPGSFSVAGSPRIIGRRMQTSTLPRRSLADVFAGLRSRRHIGVFPFVAAGYPNLQTTALLLPALEQAGASAIEIGIPFSDPIADGPVIQEAFSAALANKIKVADIFATVAGARPHVSIPLLAMVSYSIVFRHDPARFFADAKAAGFDALIIPDLPPPEAQKVCGLIRSAGLDTVLLVAPTTAPQRRAEIVRLSSGFVYYMSISGITGERDKLPADLAENIRLIRSAGDAPVCAGFGISKPEHVRQLAGIADGAIVGSGLVRRLKQHENEPPHNLARIAADYCRELVGVNQ